MRTTMIFAMAALALTLPAPVHAFCGFYVAGSDQEMVNDATMVVLMREGSRTVLSMQNHYEGPPENFAMVIPVPVVLEEDHVKVLKNEVFERIDHLAAPRLVEYWEQDPCYVEPDYEEDEAMEDTAAAPVEYAAEGAGSMGVTVEAEFTVGEYDIVILSAEDSSGLDAWLRDNEYAIPEGAEPVLRPYVEQGMKFFVAKVDVTKVRFVEGRAELSPLRFHYDSDQFALPVRLGLLNAEGKQDLLVHVLAPGQRYEVANYENVTVPTNVDVANEVRERFAEFYAALFDETLAQNPAAIVTEYAWQATNCDPCPGPVLDQNDLMTFGADVLPSLAALQGKAGSSDYWQAQSTLMNFVITRLHARYDRETLTEDLVFRAAPPIVGGREFLADDGELEHGSRPASQNNFQGRYAIRHEWDGPIECANPVRGRWGGPPAGMARPGTTPATDVAFAERGELELPQSVRSPVPELGLDAFVPAAETPAGPTAAATVHADPEDDDGCGSCATTGGPAGGLLALVGFALLGRRRRR
ncbi:MAG: hypothetical protein CMN30_30840 [Sandaracinus sp.]|nr:hypothetical protein [Sandaracinus sp.]